MRLIATFLLLLMARGTAAAEPAPPRAAGTGEAFRNLLRGSPDPDLATPTGETALHAAAQANDVEAALKLMTAGARVQANHYGWTPLHLACVNGSARMVHHLLDAGAAVAAPLPDGSTPLMIAARTGSVDTVGLLLDRGADPNARESGQQQTALMWAAAEGHAEVVRRLVERAAGLDAASKGGFTALHFASRQGHLDTVRTLLQLGANPNLPAGSDRKGSGALGLAVTNLHFELGALLLQTGADPNHTWAGRTVAHVLTWACRPGIGTNSPPPPGSGRLDRLDFVRELKRHGADLNRRMTAGRAGVRTVLNFRGATPFLLAARTADAPLMRVLAELGADPLIANEDGTTPLLVAAGVGTQSPEEDPGTEPEVFEAVKVAVELGNDVNAVDRRGETAMHGAAYKYAARVVPYLAEHGAKIEVWNTKNRTGWTPLRIATGVHRAMNLRSSPPTAAALRSLMVAAGVSTELEPETNISGATN